MPTLTEQAVAYIKAGDIEKGKQLLAEVLKQNPRDENAWLWMSRCVTDAEQKRYCFNRVLKINPQNQHAIEGLRRLNNPPLPKTEPKPEVIQQQPVPRGRPQKSNPLTTIFAVIGLLGFVCVFGMAWLFFSAQNNSGNSNQINNPAPTQIPTRTTKPNYKQMLEINGFAYRMDDDEGDPIYVSPCGCVVTVKPDYTGFAAYYDPDNDCAMQDLGAIISIMYPSEVFEFIISNMNSVIVKDTTVHGTAAGYDINIDFDPYDPKLIMTIEDPR